MNSAEQRPRFDRFFSLRDPVSRRAFRGGWEVHRDAWGLLFGTVRYDQPVHVPYAMGGRTLEDFIWTLTGFAVLVSDRVVDAFSHRGITGWTTYEVRVTKKGGEEIPGYHGLSVVGRSGPIDYRDSIVVMRQMPGGWYPYLRGASFEEESWDGSDLFLERPDAMGLQSAQMYASSRAVDALRSIGSKNIKIVALSEVETSLDRVQRDRPHRLPSDIDARVNEAAYVLPGGERTKRR